jgi:hypothetical protein
VGAAAGMAARARRTENQCPVVVKHHSPTGFEIGYPGPGPADIALNTMAVCLRRKVKMGCDALSAR